MQPSCGLGVAWGLGGRRWGERLRLARGACVHPPATAFESFSRAATVPIGVVSPREGAVPHPSAPCPRDYRATHWGEVRRNSLVSRPQLSSVTFFALPYTVRVVRAGICRLERKAWIAGTCILLPMCINRSRSTSGPVDSRTGSTQAGCRRPVEPFVARSEGDGQARSPP
jgi:hypothetical protein